jgi:putative transposase
MKKAHSHYTVSELCQVLDVASSSYYYQAQAPSLADIELITQIKCIAKETGNTYGKRRMQVELASLGHDIGLYRIASLMKKADVLAIRPMRKHYYPDAGMEQQYAPNILKRQFNPDTHNTHMVGDITYIRTWQGWSYLACVMDLSTKEVVGYALSQSPNAQLAVEALNNAIKCKQPNTQDLLFHSDQGVQYSASLFRNRLSELNMTQSMSRRGNCWDNAVMERFFRSLKTERLNHLSFINHQSVVSTVENYIRFYNYKRRHSGLDYMTPHQKFIEMKKTA